VVVCGLGCVGEGERGWRQWGRFAFIFLLFNVVASS